MREIESNDCRGNVRVLEQRAMMLRFAKWLTGATVIVAVSYGALVGYRSWRQQHLEHQAQDFAARGDLPNAVLVARRVLALNENSQPAMHVMADMAERNGSAEAVEWRKLITVAQPGNPENQFALAQAALRFGQLTLAERALDKVIGAPRETARFHQLAGGIALIEKHQARAEEHFAKAQQLEPENHHVALNVAVLRLASADPRGSEISRAELRRLAELADTRAAALRALAADALARSDRTEAARLATQLISVADKNLADRFILLEATLGTEAGPDAVREAQTIAASSPSTAAELMTWMNRHELSQQALAWSRSLPPEILDTQPVPLATAEALSCTRDWPELSKFVNGKNWHAQEALRLAIEGHAQQHLPGGEAAAGTLWRAAVKVANGQPDQLTTLAQLELGWGYKAQAEEALWSVANSNSNALVALSSLQQLYQRTGNTRGLLHVAKRALELNPNDFVAANNCANLGLLLHSDSSSRRLAAKLYSEYPGNTALAATQAFALHTEGKTAEGLRIIGTLSDAQLRVPSVAAYYVVMLVANGENDRALTFLPAAKNAALLPEERQLLAEATHKLLGKAIASSVRN